MGGSRCAQLWVGGITDKRSAAGFSVSSAVRGFVWWVIGG
jgi:hypothetical protein